MQNNRLHHCWELMLDAFFPRQCCVCSHPAEAPSGWRYLCSGCKKQIHWIEEPSCTQCGGAFDGSLEGKICGQCEILKPGFNQGRSFLRFKGPGRTLVHTLKYHAGKHVLPDIARIMAQRPDILQFIENATLVPVPLHWRKQFFRGFNQSLLIANELNKLAPTTRITPILRRVKFTRSQTRLKRETRWDNVKNAFAIRPKTRLDSKIRYILVDDVYTTGATLKMCASLLKAHGATHVDVVTLCHG